MLNTFLILLPAIVYGLLIYLTLPYKTIDLRKGLVFLLFGSISVSLLSTFQNLFPEWYEVASDNYLTQAFILMFFRVAIIEELVKFSVFYLVERLYGNQEKDYPTATMFYAAMAALSFAIIENSQYLNQYGPDVLIIRFFTATIMHMITGLFLGYWIALSRLRYDKNARSVYDVIMKNNNKLRHFAYILIALLINVVYHGLYNFNIQVNGPAAFPMLIMILIFGLALAKIYADGLISLKNSSSRDK